MSPLRIIAAIALTVLCLIAAYAAVTWPAALETERQAAHEGLN